MLKRFFSCLAAVLLISSLAAAPQLTILVWAPGYPGDTEQAQQTMDAFALAVARSAGWPRGSVRAVYHPTVEAGRQALASPETAIAMVPSPLYYEFGQELGLNPLLQAEPVDGIDEVWSVVAAKGRVSSPASLAGWELTGAVGYAPRFVRGPLLGSWGQLPDSARIVFTSRVLGALRRSAGGEKVAVLADRAQAGALAALPFAGDLEVVARSEPFPASFVCAVGERLTDARRSRLRAALLAISDTAEGRELLGSMRLVGFGPLDPRVETGPGQARR